MKAMDIRARLENDLKDAMRSGDSLRKNTIRMALSAMRLLQIENGAPLDESGQIAVLQKEIKSRQDAISDAQRANRPDLAALSQDEIAILQTYLPQPFTSEELNELVRQCIQEAGAASPSDMGKVMKLLNPRLQGRATGSQASQAVRQMLQS